MIPVKHQWDDQVPSTSQRGNPTGGKIRPKGQPSAKLTQAEHDVNKPSVMVNQPPSGEDEGLEIDTGDGIKLRVDASEDDLGEN